MTANAKFFRHGDGSIGKFNGGCSISKHWTEQILQKADVQVKISSKLNTPNDAMGVSSNILVVKTGNSQYHF